MEPEGIVPEGPGVIRNTLIDEIFNATGLQGIIDQYNVRTESSTEAIGLDDIRERLTKYPTQALQALLELLKRDDYTTYKNAIVDADTALFPIIDEMIDQKKYNNIALKDLKTNLVTLQINTLLINCHKIEEKELDPQDKQMLQDFITALENKVKVLNRVHNSKRREDHLFKPEEVQAGGVNADELEKKKIIEDFIGHSPLLTGFLNEKLEEMANDMRDLQRENIEKYNLEIASKETPLFELAEQLKAKDAEIMDAFHKIVTDNPDLADSYRNLMKELVKLQLNVLLIYCENVEGEQPSIVLPIKELSDKFMLLNQLHTYKDERNNNLGNPIQQGGSFYARKYNKYKTKYLSLKKQMH